jgi:hypothetical protein
MHTKCLPFVIKSSLVLARCYNGIKIVLRAILRIWQNGEFDIAILQL